jgi:metal-responsive CopG/Arc/MetJ family transcriptional regulator
MEIVVKRRVTVSLETELLVAVDSGPGASRSEKIEQLLRAALGEREHRQWVDELAAFYKAEPDAEDRREDLEWQALASKALAQDD